MNINGNSLHCRIFKWWYRNKYGSTPYQSNLCPYMRAVMFWAPLRALFWNWIEVFKIGEATVCLDALTIPVALYGVPKLLGYASYGVKTWFWLLYAALMCSVACVLTIRFFYWILSKCGQSLRRSLDSKIGRTTPKFLTELEEFSRLLREYLRSAHDRVCPEVRF